jgi:hypothetical protein
MNINDLELRAYSLPLINYSYSESGAVTGLRVTSTNDTVLLISWGPPVSPNGVILSYSVNIIDLGDGASVRQENTVSTSVMQMNLGVYL